MNDAHVPLATVTTLEREPDFAACVERSLNATAHDASADAASACECCRKLRMIDAVNVVAYFG